MMLRGRTKTKAIYPIKSFTRRARAHTHLKQQASYSACDTMWSIVLPDARDDVCALPFWSFIHRRPCIRCASLINELLVEKKIGKKYPQIAGTFLPRKYARRAVAILTRSTTIANFIIRTNRNLIIFIRRQSTARIWREKKIITKNHNKFNEQSICRMDGGNKRAIRIWEHNLKWVFFC